jgi:hypothetical protein
MSTKTTTTSNQNTQQQGTQNQSNQSSQSGNTTQSGGFSNQNQYAPGALDNYQQATQGWMKPALGYAQNPFGNPFFQQQQQMGTRQAMNQGQTGMNNLMSNFTSSGAGGGIQSPFMQEMMANQGRANSGLQAQLGFMNPMNQAQGMQQSAMGQLAGYNPLQTGQSGTNFANQGFNTSQSGSSQGNFNQSGSMNGNQTQSTGGLGTWLPQMLSMGMGLATGGMGGGALAALHGLGGSAAQGNINGIGQGMGDSSILGGSLGSGFMPNTNMFNMGMGSGPGGFSNNMMPANPYMPGVS